MEQLRLKRQHDDVEIVVDQMKMEDWHTQARGETWTNGVSAAAGHELHGPLAFCDSAADGRYQAVLVGTLTAFPVTLCHAMTIALVQGLEFSRRHVVVNVPESSSTSEYLRKWGASSLPSVANHQCNFTLTSGSGLGLRGADAGA